METRWGTHGKSKEEMQDTYTLREVFVGLQGGRG